MRGWVILCGVFFSLISITSCRRVTLHEWQGERTYDLKDIAEETEDNGADAFLRDFCWIQLETREDCLVGSHSRIVNMTDSDLILCSGNELYRFSHSGKFLNLIGKFGHGHGEHGKIVTAFEHPDDGHVYILSYGGKLTIYGKTGNFLGTREILPPKDYMLTSVMSCPHVGLIGELRRYRGDGLDVKLAWIDCNGEIKKDTTIYTDNQNVSVDRGTFSLSYRVADTTLFKLDFEDKVYAISERGVKSALLDLGNLSPDRKMLEDLACKEELLCHKCQILDLRESSNYVYLIAFFGQKFRLVMLDKNSDQTVYNRESGNPQKNGGLKVKGFSSLRVWPSWTDGRRVAALVSPGFLDAADLARLNEAVCCPYPVTADANPVLFCAE